MERSDWALLVIAAAKGEPFDPIQLQKALFLLGENLALNGKEDYYSFQPYNYGPFDKAVYADASSLAEKGYINAARMHGRSWSSYCVTPPGLSEAEKLRSKLEESQCEFIDSLVSWLRKLSFEQLLSYIYQKYPSFAQNSMFRLPS
jgi:hypothetical protein